jgi:hypothetical protein
MDDWRKSSYSGSNGGQCVEIASAEGVAVRDTADRDGMTLTFGPEAWATFASSLKYRRPGPARDAIISRHLDASHHRRPPGE